MTQNKIEGLTRELHEEQERLERVFYKLPNKNALVTEGLATYVHNLVVQGKIGQLKEVRGLFRRKSDCDDYIDQLEKELRCRE